MALQLRPGADVGDARLEDEVEPLLFLSQSRLSAKVKKSPAKIFAAIENVAILL